MKRLALVLCLCAMPAAADEHILSSLPAGVALTPAQFDAKLDGDAQQFRQERPGDEAVRFIEYDMAVPLEGDEFEAFGHRAVALIGAESHDASELPLARVYVLAGGREIELKRIASTMRELDTGAAAEVYGRYRQDAFYLVPVEFLRADVKILCDFAANRTGFTIAAPPDPPPDYAKGKAATGAGPSPEALRSFLDREYPGFVKDGQL